MLDRSTLDRLAARAREASDIAGGGVDLRPADLLAVGFEPAGIEIRRTRRKKASDGHVVVTVKDAAGHTTDVRLRSEEGRWKIVLDF